MGKVGYFFLGNDGQWKVMSDENLDIIFDVDADYSFKRPFIEKFPCQTAVQRYQPKTIGGFIIRDDKGFCYEFGNPRHSSSDHTSVTDAIEYNTPFLCMGDNENSYSWIASSWYLTKVTDRLGNVLYELEYTRSPFCAQVFRNYYRTEKTEQASTNFFLSNLSFGSVSGTSNSSLPYSMQLDAPTRLTRITAANGVTVNFYSSADSIGLRTLYQNNNDESLSYDWYNQLRGRVNNTTAAHREFYYLQSPEFAQYQADPNSDPYDGLLERMGLMRLNSIGIQADYSGYYHYRLYYDDNGRSMISKVSRQHYINGGEHTDYSYILDYNNKNSLPTSALTSMVDHWGYYNGRSYSQIADGNTIDSVRRCDTTLMKKGTLSRIIYPTGGVSVFEFEPNTYGKSLNNEKSSWINEPGVGAGLRIKRISEYEDTTCAKLLQRRTFSYNIPGSETSSGELYAKPCYRWDDWCAYATGHENTSVSITTVKTTSIVPLTNSFGSAIGYSYVTETFEDGSKNIYRYYNISDHSRMFELTETGGINSPSSSPYDKFTEHDSHRGKLLYTTAWDSIGKKVSATRYNYRSISNIENEYTIAANFGFEGGMSSGSFAFFHGRQYRLFHKRCDLSSIIDTTFLDSTNYIVDKTEFTYQDNNITFTTPYSRTVPIRNLYVAFNIRGSKLAAKRYTYTNALEAGDNRKQLATSYFDLGPVATENFIDATLVGGNEVLYRPYSINSSNQLMPYQSLRHFANNITDTVLTVNEYSTTGQITEFTPKGEYPYRVKWDRRETLPLLLWQGPSYSLTEVDNLISNDLYAAYRTNEMTEALKNVTKMGYCPNLMGWTYDGFGKVKSTVTADGIATYYEYDEGSTNLHKVLNNSREMLLQFNYYFKIK